MARFIGVEGGRTLGVGLFNPPKHKGVDVFAPPGSEVYVPRGWRLTITQSTFDPNYYKGQARGWVEICGRRYGFVAAHFAAAPEVGEYRPGDLYGHVSGNVQYTPHIHFALADDHIPPPGEYDPVETWRVCLRRRRRRRRRKLNR